MRIKILRTYPKGKLVPVAWAIAKVQGTNYDHFAIEIKGSVIDASREDVRIHSKAEFCERYNITHMDEIEVWHDFEREIFPWMISVCNRGYGFVQIFGLLLKQIGLIRRNPFGGNSKTIICNELVLMFLRKFNGLKLTKDIDDYDLLDTEKVVKEISQC